MRDRHDEYFLGNSLLSVFRRTEVVSEHVHVHALHVEMVTHSCVKRKSLLVSLFEVEAEQSRNGWMMERLLKSLFKKNQFSVGCHG